MQRYQVLLILSSLIFLFSCSRDKLVESKEVCTDEITYRRDVMGIINKSCAYSGCHDGSNAPGDYNTYQGISPFLNDSKFYRRVIVRRDMPPNYSSGPTFLTSEQIATVICWAEGNYQED